MFPKSYVLQVIFFFRFFFFLMNGNNYSHILVGLANGSLAQVFQEPACQVLRLTKVRAGICRLIVVPAIAHVLFTKDTLESLMFTN